MNTDLRPKVYIAFCKPWRALDRRRRIAAVLTKALTRSDLTHVAVSNGDAVISPTFERTVYYPHINFFQNFPTIHSTIQVRVDRLPDMDQYGHTRPLSIGRSVLKHLSRGVIPAEDCVSIACDVLRYGGVSVPRCVTSPVALRRHLLKHNQEEQHGTDTAVLARSHRHAQQAVQAAHCARR